jgi:Holliday junction resolvase RusA-like endonuclease
MIEILIKPLSVNEAFKGKRYKTDKYDKFIRNMLFLLPTITLPQAPYSINIILGYSSKASDIDNGLKSLLDCLVKKYGFDDREIYQMNVKKEIVPKTKEFIKFELTHYIK